MKTLSPAVAQFPAAAVERHKRGLGLSHESE